MSVGQALMTALIHAEAVHEAKLFHRRRRIQVPTYRHHNFRRTRIGLYESKYLILM
jgi:hypothetical protein